MLVAVGLLRETYARELARGLDIAPLSVQRILKDYEREGVLVSYLRGRTRIFSLNARFIGVAHSRCSCENMPRTRM